MKLTTRKQYDDVKARVEQLIQEATEKGLLESDLDNNYTREIALLSQQMADYEDELDHEGPSKDFSTSVEITKGGSSPPNPSVYIQWYI